MTRTVTQSSSSKTKDQVAGVFAIARNLLFVAVCAYCVPFHTARESVEAMLLTGP